MKSTYYGGKLNINCIFWRSIKLSNGYRTASQLRNRSVFDGKTAENIKKRPEKQGKPQTGAKVALKRYESTHN